MKNYICFGGRFRVKYAYFDSHEYSADSLFNKHNLLVKFDDEYAKDGESYRVIFCSIRRKDNEKFKQAMKELYDKMLMCGHKDYEDFCIGMMDWIGEHDKKE